MNMNFIQTNFWIKFNETNETRTAQNNSWLVWMDTLFEWLWLVSPLNSSIEGNVRDYRYTDRRIISTSSQ